MLRREFIRRVGLLAGAAPAIIAAPAAAATPHDSTQPFDPKDWSSVRDQFSIDRSRVHMAAMLLASHPRPVAEQIERHRRAFDTDPYSYWRSRFKSAERTQRAAAGVYLDANPDHIALTDSTTMGLGLIYGALRIAPDQEILTTTHDHYSTAMALQHRADRTGTEIRRISLYDDPAEASVDEIVSRVRRALTSRTRVLAITWVHSSTGVKLPVAEISRVVREENRSRDLKDRVLFCLDGVHGLGIEDATVAELGCDFLIAGTHKWLCGPRGTGIVWGNAAAWDAVSPVIPAFGKSLAAWRGQISLREVPVGAHMTPGGFHSFEHRWALHEAFGFHLAIGKKRIEQRTHRLSTMLKERLSEMHEELLPSLHELVRAEDARSGSGR